jgi:hypothetical protein
MWTYEIVSLTENEVRIKYINNGRCFTKIHVIDVQNDIENEYIHNIALQHIEDIEVLEITYNFMKTLVNVDSVIAEGWVYRLSQINMPADWLEVYIELDTPFGKFQKMYNIVDPRTIEFINEWMQNEVEKFVNWINTSDWQSISSYFGIEIGGES